MDVGTYYGICVQIYTFLCNFIYFKKQNSNIWRICDVWRIFRSNYDINMVDQFSSLFYFYFIQFILPSILIIWPYINHNKKDSRLFIIFLILNELLVRFSISLRYKTKFQTLPKDNNFNKMKSILIIFMIYNIFNIFDS